MNENSFRSDPDLLGEVRKFGRFDTNACLQCGSCTVSCDLTSDSASFPRRTLRFVLLGLRKPLQSSLEPWLCYYCGDCSTGCPMETDPGEGMMTLRRYLAAQYDWTGLSSRIYRSPVWHIGAILTAAVSALLCVLLYHLVVVGMRIPDLAVGAGSIGLEHMHGGISFVTRAVFLLPAIFVVSNAARMFWLTGRGGAEFEIPFWLYLAEAKVFISHALTQRSFRECADTGRWFVHALLASACTLMFILLFFGISWFQTDSFYPLYHPQRLLRYLITGALLYSTVKILACRKKGLDQAYRFSKSSDWILPILLILTTLSGILLHGFRYLGLGAAAHYSYIAHIAIVVPMLMVEIPFAKWSHMLYRPLATYLWTVRLKAMRQQSPQQVVSRHAA